MRIKKFLLHPITISVTVGVLLAILVTSLNTLYQENKAGDKEEPKTEQKEEEEETSNKEDTEEKSENKDKIKEREEEEESKEDTNEFKPLGFTLSEYVESHNKLAEGTGSPHLSIMFENIVYEVDPINSNVQLGMFEFSPYDSIIWEMDRASGEVLKVMVIGEGVQDPEIDKNMYFEFVAVTLGTATPNMSEETRRDIYYNKLNVQLVDDIGNWNTIVEEKEFNYTVNMLNGWVSSIFSISDEGYETNLYKEGENVNIRNKENNPYDSLNNL